MNSLKEIDTSMIKWKSIRKEGLDLDYTVAIPRPIASNILKEIENTVVYFTGELSKIIVFGKVYPLPRQQVAYGDPGITYRYSGKTIPALPWPAPVLALRDFLEAIKGIKYDFVLVNKYRNGNDHMGEHRDNEPELDPAYPIASISFGQERAFVLKHKDARKPGPDKKPIPPVIIDLEHGSILFMNPPTNEIWYHSLPTRKKLLGRSYKYMIASKMPSLRMDQSDLKCKSGCDYYGNPQWGGYCSECHRQQLAKQRKAEKEKASAASATLPRQQARLERGRLAPHSSFSKFEEKRLRQSETLKKANLLKFSVFGKKASSDDHDTVDKRPEFKIPPSVLDNMKRESRARFPALSRHAEHDARAFAYTFMLDVIKCADVMSVDELAERVQRQYQRFMKHMETSPHFANIDSECKEALMDFVEKHAMTYLHELPSVVFSPSGTDDERADRALSERIQQLSWVGEKQLECRLAEPARCRRLLYRAISELLGMDSAMSPGGKLARVRRCCRHVLALCGAPASADDLLPALIFTVLKANPPRLVSNINFVNRFCNAQRIMTGEGGYYFTNLCCAVSFIENMTAESLHMDKKEFDCYMSMPASIGGSSWAVALSLCAELREAEEQAALAASVLTQARAVSAGADELAATAETFEQEIEKKVQDVLAKTPLEIKPRRTLPKIGKLKALSEPLIEIEATLPAAQNTASHEQKQPEIDETDARPTEPKPDAIQTQPTNAFELEVTHEKLNILGFEELTTPPKSPQLDQNWDLKQTSSMELLTSSPLGFTPFDSRSIDELMTPDEFVSEHLAPGLSNINYDIDFSDLSGENSIADDAPKQDPFSPEGLKKGTFDPFAPQPPRDPFSPVQGMFDQFTLEDPKTRTSDPFEIVQKKDPFSPIPSASQKATRDPFSPEQKASILDDNDSPTTECLLPSPLLPQSGGKQT